MISLDPSLRDPEVINQNGDVPGAWFIYALSKVFNSNEFSNNKEVEVHQALMKVNDEVSHYVGQFMRNEVAEKTCQMPEFRSTMRKPLFLHRTYSGHGNFYREMMSRLEKKNRHFYEEILVLEEQIEVLRGLHDSILKLLKYRTMKLSFYLKYLMSSIICSFVKFSIK